MIQVQDHIKLKSQTRKIFSKLHFQKFVAPKSYITAASFEIVHWIVRQGKPLSEEEFE